MRSYFFAFILCIAAALTLQSARADSTITGETLLSICESTDQTTHTICIGYLRGFTDGAVIQSALTKTKMFYCVPSDSTLGYAELADVFAARLKAVPDLLTKPAGAGFANAMTAKFPCK